MCFRFDLFFCELSLGKVSFDSCFGGFDRAGGRRYYVVGRFFSVGGYSFVSVVVGVEAFVCEFGVVFGWLSSLVNFVFTI